MTTEITESKNYLQTLEDIKQRVKNAQIKAHLSVNREMLILYWQIGEVILEQRKTQKWGSKVIEKLTLDLKSEFNTMKGLSTTNLKYMAIFAENYPDLLVAKHKKPIGQQPIDQLELNYFINDKLSVFLNIPWGHNIDIMTNSGKLEQNIWYAQNTIKNSWSRNVLAIQIQSNLYKRQAIKEVKVNNFQLTLPEENSDLANDIFKDEYNFEFIDNSKGRLAERAIEKALIDDVIKFLTELGQGFAFVGKQYHLEAGGEDYYIDLLFYHLKLRSYIIIELKTTKFKPEYAGKMAFYLSQIDKKLKSEVDNNSIGIILCPDPSSDEVRETINYITKPMGVAGYQLAADKKEIPKELKSLEELKNII
jgi:predicted nuclease of restriction endonuclease-like (RecB) superfamily